MKTTTDREELLAENDPKTTVRLMLKEEETPTFTRDQFDTLCEIVREDYTHLLFPNSPLEVVVDQTSDYFHLSIMSEGEWRENAYNVRQARAALTGIIATDGFHWSLATDAIRLRPEWSGWTRLNETGLMAVIGEVC